MPLVPLLLLILLAVSAAVAVRALLVHDTVVERAAEERAVRAVRWCSLVAGVVVAYAVGGGALDALPLLDRGLGAGAVVVPTAFGLTVLLGAVAGELLVRPRFADGPRVADLRPRRVRDHLPRRASLLLAVTAALGAVLCAFTWATAGTDDMGRAGRVFPYSCEPGHTGARSPYPGEFYLTPYVTGVALALVVAVLAATVVTRRGLGGTPEQADQHRATGLAAVVGALGVVVAAPLAGIAFFTATVLLGVECAGSGARATGVLALVLVPLAVVTVATSLAHLFVPRGPVHPTAPAGMAPERADA